MPAHPYTLRPVQSLCELCRPGRDTLDAGLSQGTHSQTIGTLQTPICLSPSSGTIRDKEYLEETHIHAEKVRLTEQAYKRQLLSHPEI